VKNLFRLTKKRNKADCFTQLIHAHASFIYRTAFKLTGCQADAEDIVQEMLIRLYPKTDELSNIKALRPWLYRVLYHQFIDFRRKQSRMPISEQNREHLPGEDIVDTLAGNEPSPETLSERQQQSEVVLNALQKLSDENRALVVLHLIEGFTLEELAGMLELPLGTIKSRLHRSKNLLKKVLLVEPFAVFERDRDIG